MRYKVKHMNKAQNIPFNIRINSELKALIERASNTDDLKKAPWAKRALKKAALETLKISKADTLNVKRKAIQKANSERG